MPPEFTSGYGLTDVIVGVIVAAVTGVSVGRMMTTVVLVGVTVGVAVGQPPASAQAGVGSKTAAQRKNRSKARVRFMR